jgi:hypothetical protein
MFLSILMLKYELYKDFWDWNSYRFWATLTCIYPIVKKSFVCKTFCTFARRLQALGFNKISFSHNSSPSSCMKFVEHHMLFHHYNQVLIQDFVSCELHTSFHLWFIPTYLLVYDSLVYRLLMAFVSSVHLPSLNIILPYCVLMPPYVLSTINFSSPPPFPLSLRNWFDIMSSPPP